MPRLFVAARVAPTPELSRVLTRLSGVRGVKAVSPVNIHYTLRFFGDVDDALAASLTSMLPASPFGVPAFDAHIERTGAFPSVRQPRVVWAGCDPASEAPFAALAAAVDKVADGCSAPPRDKPFVPHLTLARVKVEGGRGADECAAILADEAATRYGTARIDRVQLVESVIMREGPTYTDIAEVRLP